MPNPEAATYKVGQTVLTKVEVGSKPVPFQPPVPILGEVEGTILAVFDCGYEISYKHEGEEKRAVVHHINCKAGPDLIKVLREENAELKARIKELEDDTSTVDASCGDESDLPEKWQGNYGEGIKGVATPRDGTDARKEEVSGSEGGTDGPGEGDVLGAGDGQAGDETEEPGQAES